MQNDQHPEQIPNRDQNTMAATQTLSFPNAYRSPDILSNKSFHGDVEDTMMQHTFDSLGASHINTHSGATVMSPPRKEEMAQLHYRTQSQGAKDLDIGKPSSSTVLFPQTGDVSATNPSNNTASASAAAAAAAKKRMQSCDICRIRKVKCIRSDEAGMGRCRQCESNDAKCTYTYVPKKPGPQTSSAKSIARREEKDRQIRAAAAAAMLAKGVHGSGSGKGKGMMKSNKTGTESGGERSSGSSRRSSIPGGQISPALIQQASFDFGVHGHHPNMHSGQNSEGISPVDFGSHRQNNHPIPYPSHLAMSSLMSAYQPSPSGSNSMANSTPSSYNGVSGMPMDNPLFIGQKSRPGSPSYVSASLPFGTSPASSSGLHGHSGSHRAACLHSNHSQPVSASSSRSSSPRLHKIHNTNSTNTFAHAFTPINPIVPLHSSNPGHQSIPSGLHGADALLSNNDQVSAPHGDPTLNFPWSSIPHSNQGGMPGDAMAWHSMPQQANPSQAAHPFLPPNMPAISSGSNYDPIAMSHQMYEYALQWQQQQQHRVNDKIQGGETKEKNPSQLNSNQIPSTQQQSEQWSDFWQFPANHQGPHW